MHWLDRIIEEQAKCYGLPVERFCALMSGAARHQQAIESGKAREPVTKNNTIPTTHLERAQND